MLPKRLRFPLRKRGTFFDTARRLHTRFFVCWYAQENELFRSSVVVSRRVSLHAVDRNQLKRRMREILMQVTAPNGLKTVFVMKRAALELSPSQLATEVQQTIDRIVYETAHPASHRRID